MAKVHTSMASKGKWLELDSHSKSSENILSIVRTISDADIKVIAGRTYIRFPISQEKKKPLFSRMIKIGIYAKRQATESQKSSKPRQYCAVMLKTEK